jgi:transposase
LRALIKLLAEQAFGRLAKTDRLDAKVLAHFDEAVRPEAWPLGGQQAQALDALVTRRRQFGLDADGGEQSPVPSSKGFTPQHR